MKFLKMFFGAASCDCRLIHVAPIFRYLNLFHADNRMEMADWVAPNCLASVFYDWVSSSSFACYFLQEKLFHLSTNTLQNSIIRHEVFEK